MPWIQHLTSTEPIETIWAVPTRAMFSPFQHHSAAITEYWSFGEAPLQWWLDLSSPPSYRLKHVLKRLGFPLESSCDRVGNLLIARAEDAFTAETQF